MARTGYTAETTGLPAEAPEWTITFKKPIVSSPSVVNGIVYVGCRDSVFYAIDLYSGSILWSYKTGGWVDSSPFVTQDKVLVGSRDGYIYQFDNETGRLIFRLAAGLQLSSPVLTKGGEILSGIGPPYNRFSVFTPDVVGPEWAQYFTQPSYSSPAVQDDIAVIASNEGVLYAINYETHKILWQFKTNGGAYLSTPSIKDSIVYFAPGDYDPYVYALDLLTGKDLWVDEEESLSLANRGGAITGAYPMLLHQLSLMKPTHRKATLNFLNGQQHPLAKVMQSNKQNKTGSDGIIPGGGGIKTSSVTVGTENLYVIQRELGYSNDEEMRPVSRYTLFALNKNTGLKTWDFSAVQGHPAPGYNSSPIMAGDKIFFGWGDGKMYVLQASSGEVLGERELDGHIVSSPAVAEGKLVVGTMNGTLYSYALNATAPGLSFEKSTYCYPNPAKGDFSHIQVYVTKSAKIEIIFYNIAQRPILRKSKQLSPNEKWTYDWKLTSVANGVYFARVSAKYSDGSKDRKFLKIGVLR
ncbi:MAG: PQQ-binding-like beta-propeller repeat protein [Fibrobacteria bacterium]|nr:PQQ-binding-like beta-propeller repeat protein [Fibrobacteria bacterium]